MNTEYKSLLPADFAGDSRVWIYQSNRLFTMQEALQIEVMLEEFTAGWNSHGAPVKGFATLFFGRFVVLMADESATGVSGCSTDSSVRLVREIGERFGVSLFDRQLLAFLRADKVELLPMGQFGYAWEQGFIGPDTLYFDNTVQTKSEMTERWMVPVSRSWLAKRIGSPA
jgi:hypothetical protein